MVVKYVLEELRDDGWHRVVHEDGYVYAFDDFDAACESARNLRKHYAMQCAVQKVEVGSFVNRLPLTLLEGLQYQAEQRNKASAVRQEIRDKFLAKERQKQEVLDLSKRRIRIRKGGK